MRSLVISTLLPLVAISYAVPVHADDKKKPRDPNQMVCESEDILGSRLATRRVCMTRAQWAEKQREDRATIDRSQTQGCVAMNGQCTHG